MCEGKTSFLREDLKPDIYDWQILKQYISGNVLYFSAAEDSSLAGRSVAVVIKYNSSLDLMSGIVLYFRGALEFTHLLGQTAIYRHHLFPPEYFCTCCCVNWMVTLVAAY